MKTQLVTFDQLTPGEKIKHHVWGEIKFTSKSGQVYSFVSKEYGVITLVDFGIKFKRA